CTSCPCCRSPCQGRPTRGPWPPALDGSSAALLLGPWLSPFGVSVYWKSARAGSAFGDGPLLEEPGPLDEEVDDVASQTRVLGLVDDVRPGARAWQLDLDDFGQARVGSVRHEGDPVREEDRLVDVVRDHEYGVA